MAKLVGRIVLFQAPTDARSPGLVQVNEYKFLAVREDHIGFVATTGPQNVAANAVIEALNVVTFVAVQRRTVRLKRADAANHRFAVDEILGNH